MSTGPAPPERSAASAAPGGYRVGFFSAFYPMTARAGGGATGLALLLSRLPSVARLTVYAPTEAQHPPASDPRRLELVPIWTPDRPLSLLRSLRRMARDAPQLDGFIFSIYVASFGRGSLTNGLGLLLPVLTRRLNGRPVLVIMHNFVETQDLPALGYEVSPIALRLARFLERLVIAGTTTVVGLESQKRTVEATVGGSVTFVPMVYMDAVNSWLSAPPPTGPRAPEGAGDPRTVRLLLFGSWGPQKDLDGAFALLRDVAAAGERVHVTVAGSANPNFPDYVARLAEWRRTLPSATFTFLGHVEEGDVRALFEAHDILFLPYLASGGFSGVMNFAAMYECPVVAYEQAQLRECARTLGARATFIARGDAAALRAVLDGLRGPDGAVARRSLAAEPAWLTGARRSAEAVLALAIRSAGAPSAGA